MASHFSKIESSCVYSLKMRVFELRETPEPTIIMAYYPLGNIVEASVVDDEKHITAFGTSGGFGIS